MIAKELESLAADVYLSDISSQDQPWDKHRVDAYKIQHLYIGTAFDSYARRIAGCSGLLEFSLLADGDSGCLKLKLISCFFCRVRHCPVCQWRRQLRWRARLFQALPKLLARHPKAEFIFLTLTVRNCSTSELRDTLSKMNKAWTLLTKRKVFPGIGWLKSVEVTRDVHGDSHPHFHCVIMVTQTYFGSGYLSHENWVSLWRSCLRIDYNPSVHVQRIKSKKQDLDKMDELDALMKAVCETLKYSLKPEDLVRNKDWLLEVTEQLHKTRAVAIGGIFKEFISEEEPEDLIGSNEDEESEEQDSLLWFGWREALMRYKQVER